MASPRKYLRATDVLWPRKVRIAYVDLCNRDGSLEFVLLFENEPKQLGLRREQALLLLKAFHYRFEWQGAELCLAPGLDEAGRPTIVVTLIAPPQLDQNSDRPALADYLQRFYNQ